MRRQAQAARDADIDFADVRYVADICILQEDGEQVVVSHGVVRKDCQSDNQHRDLPRKR